MKIRVVSPQAWMLTTPYDAKKQLALCAYAAGLSRGRQDIYQVPAHEGDVYVGASESTRHRTFADAEELIRKLLSYKPHPHESVIEHGSVTFLFQCSRIATHEIVRHRLCAFTQTSTRYIEEKDEVTLIRPPHMPREHGKVWNFHGDLEELGNSADPLNAITHIGDPENTPEWIFTALHSFVEYAMMRDKGVKRESARYILPHALACYIQITANFRQWRHMIRLRTSKKAAPEMQELFKAVRADLNQISPVLVEDLEEEEFVIPAGSTVE